MSDRIRIPAFQVMVEYDPPRLRVKFDGLTNHLLRAVLVGLWATLDDRDRTDFIAELAHYDCGFMGEIPELAQFIAATPGLPNGAAN